MAEWLRRIHLGWIAILAVTGCSGAGVDPITFHGLYVGQVMQTESGRTFTDDTSFEISSGTTHDLTIRLGVGSLSTPCDFQGVVTSATGFDLIEERCGVPGGSTYVLSGTGTLYDHRATLHLTGVIETSSTTVGEDFVYQGTR